MKLLDLLKIHNKTLKTLTDNTLNAWQLGPSLG